MNKTIIMLLVCFVTFIPVFADTNSTTSQSEQKIMLEQMNKTNILLQKINENLNQTNSNIVDLKKSEETNSINSSFLDSIRFQVELFSTFVVALFGVSMGLFGDRMRDWQIDQQKIRKVKDLLRNDISRISNNVNIILLDIDRLFSILKTSNDIENGIITTHGRVGENIARILINIRLLHWDAIVHSGYLIKLHTDEIGDLQSLQNYLEDTRNQLLEFYELKSNNVIAIALSQSLEQHKVSTIKIELKQLADFCHMIYQTVSAKSIRIQNNIKWLSDEYDSRTSDDKIRDWMKKLRKNHS